MKMKFYLNLLKIYKKIKILKINNNGIMIKSII